MAQMRTPAEPELLPTVEWEPCPEFTADDATPGVCVGCGWFEDDHTVEVPRAA